MEIFEDIIFDDMLKWARTIRKDPRMIGALPTNYLSIPRGDWDPQAPNPRDQEIAGAIYRMGSLILDQLKKKDIPRWQFMTIAPIARKRVRQPQAGLRVVLEGWPFGCATYPPNSSDCLKGIRPDLNNPIARTFEGRVLSEGPTFHTFKSERYMGERTLSAGPETLNVEWHNKRTLFKGFVDLCVEHKLDL